MGKSPGRWIKSVLLGKKSSKSNAFKGKERVLNEREVLVSAKTVETEATLDTSFGQNLESNPADRNESILKEENREAAIISDDGLSMPGSQQIATHNFEPEDAPSDADKLHQEKAASKVQAVFRGFLARRAFWTLKGIIRLQAVIRGHLVRRQAVATLCCAMGIVKLQALVRGRQVRHSDIGVEIQRKCSQRQPLEGKLVNSGASISSGIRKLSANKLVFQLLASSPNPMPLNIHYDSGDPNSVSSWLESWSVSHFWKPVPQPKKKVESKSHSKHVNGHSVDAETGRPKRSVRRIPAASVESVSHQTAPEIEKPKRGLRKVSSHSVDIVQENPQNELEKVKRNLRKVRTPVVENSVQLEVEFEKPKLSVEKVSTLPAHDSQEQSSSHTSEIIKKDTTLTLSVPKQPDAESTLVSLDVTETVDNSHVNEAVVDPMPLIENDNKVECAPSTKEELNHKEDSTENPKSSKKSLVVKQERAENGPQNSPTLPSYMQATQSAKAKLRLNGSPSSGLDEPEKNNIGRRQSLPSSTNSKVSSQSPRPKRLSHGGGKGGNKNDKNMLSSRDGNGKVTQVEWKR